MPGHPRRARIIRLESAPKVWKHPCGVPYGPFLRRSYPQAEAFRQAFSRVFKVFILFIALGFPLESKGYAYLS